MLSVRDYQEWWFWRQRLQEAKEKEMELRKAICEEQGVGIVKIGGIKYKSNQGVSRSIDAAALESIWDDLTQDDIDCITFKPTAKWAKISEESILWSVITEKPSAPTLTRLD